LREQVELPTTTRFRLVGVGLANFYDPDDTPAQPGLFGAETEALDADHRG
jgi:DNA polymerase-4